MIRCNALRKAKGSLTCKSLFMHLPCFEHLRRSALQFDFQLDHLPRYPFKSFEGSIVVINSQEEENSCRNAATLSKLRKSQVLGFDTETAVFWGVSDHAPPISLVQVSSEDVCVIWRLRRSKQFVYPDFPQSLKQLLCERSLLKVGCGVQQDVHELYLQYGISMANVADVQELAAKIGISRTGLASLACQLFGWRISKHRQRSNWEASHLHEPQLKYAATDAWLSLKLYFELKSMLDILNIPEPSPIHEASEFVLVRELKKDQALLRVLDVKLSEAATPQQQCLRSRRSKDKWRMDVADVDVSDLGDQESTSGSRDPNSIGLRSRERELPFYWCGYQRSAVA